MGAAASSRERRRLPRTCSSCSRSSSFSRCRLLNSRNCREPAASGQTTSRAGPGLTVVELARSRPTSSTSSVTLSGARSACSATAPPRLNIAASLSVRRCGARGCCWAAAGAETAVADRSRSASTMCAGTGRGCSTSGAAKRRGIGRPGEVAGLTACPTRRGGMSTPASASACSSRRMYSACSTTLCSSCAMCCCASSSSREMTGRDAERSGGMGSVSRRPSREHHPPHVWGLLTSACGPHSTSCGSAACAARATVTSGSSPYSRPLAAGAHTV